MNILNRFRALKFLTVGALLIFSSVLAAAQPLAGETVRADDSDFWHVQDNPAFVGVQRDIFSLGAAYATVDNSGTPTSLSDLSRGTVQIGIGIPLLRYLYTSQTGIGSDSLSAAIPFGRLGSLGYAYSWGAGIATGHQSTIGVLLRPVTFASLAGTMTTAPGTSPLFGLGVALRPLFLLPKLGSAVTLTADAHAQGGTFTMESAGAHVNISDTIGFRGWYDFERNSVGLEANLSLGPAEQHVALQSVASADSWTVGEAVRLSPSTFTEPLPFGQKILVIKDLDAVIPEGSSPGFSSFFQNQNVITFFGLISMIQHATEDPTISAIVIENLPSVGGDASDQALAGALAGFRRDGRKVYLYAEGYGDSTEFQYLASQADFIALTPTGSVNLSGQSARRLYLKDFLDKIGLHFVNLAPWPTKSAFNNFTDGQMPDAERAMLTRYLGDLQSQALAAFARGRGDRLKQSPEKTLAAGPYMTAQRALDAGLVDALQYPDELEKLVKQEHRGASLITSYPPAVDRTWGPDAFSKRVAVVELAGNIVSGNGTPGTSIGTDTANLLRKLREAPGIAGIVLRVDSPGGSATTSDEIADQVKKTVAAGKPVVVSMGDYAASGGYYVAAEASRIFAEPGTITGSIGVTGLLPNIAGTLAKLGIHSDGVDLSDSSDALDPTIQFRDRDLALAKDSILAMYDRFANVVAEGRKLNVAKVKDLGEGKVYTGQEAAKNGLVDQLGTLSDAEAWISAKLGGNVSFNEEAPGPLDRFSSMMGNRMAMDQFSANPGTSANTVDSGALSTVAWVTDSLGAMLVRTVGAPVARSAVNSLLGPSAGVLTSALRALGPYATSIADLAAMDPGPLLYFNWMELGR